MKRVRCPKCDNYITFDETRYEKGQSLVFVCPDCNKQFGVKIGISKLKNRQQDEILDETLNNDSVGAIIVIENIFQYKQILPLVMGDNVIGKYAKGKKIQCPIETADPSIDMVHCRIRVSKDKQGGLKYELSDGPSYTGTFVNNELLGKNEQRILEHGSLFSIGASSILLKLKED